MIPAKEASTPMSFLMENFSTFSKVPKAKVQTPKNYEHTRRAVKVAYRFLPLVELSIVALATVVYSRQAAVK